MESDMTGKEFLEWLDGVTHIERVEWVVEGDDCWDAEKIIVSVIADGEKRDFYFGSAKWKEYPDEFCKVAMAMIGNRIMKQAGLCSDLGPFTMYNDPTYTVNRMMEVLDVHHDQC